MSPETSSTPSATRNCRRSGLRGFGEIENPRSIEAGKGIETHQDEGQRDEGQRIVVYRPRL